MHQHQGRRPACLQQRLALIVLLTALPLPAQTLSKEYIRLNGEVIAIENVPASSSPMASVTPASISFGSQTVNTPSNGQIVTVKNTGGGSLTFSSLPTLGSTNPGDFNLSNNSCDPQHALTALATCTVTVNFNPQLQGSRSAVLTFTDNASNGLTQTVSLSGDGSGTGSGGPAGSSYSISLDGNSNELTTLPNAAPFNNLTSWRMETRLHGISNVSANGYDQYLWVMYPSGISYSLSLSSDGSTLKFLNYAENPSSSNTNQYFCNVALNGATDIQIRLQRNAGTSNYELKVWNTATHGLIGSFDSCGAFYSSTVSLSGPFIVGGLGGARGYQGGIAYFRIYNTSVSNSTPPSESAPGGELLAYEFETASNLGLETSGNNPSYPLTPSGSPIQIPTPTAGATPPSVSITAPMTNTNVSGTVNITAAATANTPGATITSVQMQLDGANFGSPITASPYSISWNTANFTNTSHALTAIATDSLGQTSTSSQVTVMVNNTAPSSHSIYFDGNSDESATLPSAAPFNNLTSWRLETRLHGITGNWNSNGYYQYFWNIYGVYSLAISADASYLLFQNVGENPPGSSSNVFYCNVPLNGATDIQIRLQRNATAQNYQLQVWNTLTSAPLTTAGNCGTFSYPTVSLAAGGLLVGGVAGQNYQGGMAYLRLYNTAITSSAPPANTKPGSELLDYEFENASNLGQETSGNTPSYQLSSSGDPTQISTPVAGATPPSVSITAPMTNTNVSGTVNITAAATANTPGATITSVQMQLDGANFGSPITASPYSISWNTANFTNTSHALTAIATDSLGQTSTSSQVTVMVNNTAPSSHSIYFDGNSDESATLPSAAPFNNLTSWRLETRLHGITGNWNSNGYYQYFWNIYGVYSLAISADASYLLFQNVGENPPGSSSNDFYCLASLNGATDIQIRLQRDATTSAQNYQLQVWNTQTGGLLPTAGDCGAISSSSVSIAGGLFVGGVAGQNYQGGMAYLRFYNTAVSSFLPPSNTRPGGELLDYEFENGSNLGLDTSGNNPLYPLSPSGNPTQISTPSGGN